MISRDRLFYCTSVFMGCASALVAWQIYLSVKGDHGSLAISQSVEKRPAPALLSGLEVQSKDLASYRIVLEKPLFSPSRRLEKDPPPPPPPVVQKPPVPVAAPVPQKPEPVPVVLKELGLSLVGIVVLNGTPQALVQSSETGKLLRLAEGTKHNDWKLKEIRQEDVVFSQAEEIRTLPIKVQK